VAVLDDEWAGFLPLSSLRADVELFDEVGAELVAKSGMNPARLEKRGLFIEPKLLKAPKFPRPPRPARPGKPPNTDRGFFGSREVKRGFLGSIPDNGLFFGSSEAPKRAAVLGSKAPNRGFFGSKAAKSGFLGSRPKGSEDKKLGFNPAKFAKFSPDVEAAALVEALGKAEDVFPVLPLLDVVGVVELRPALRFLSLVSEVGVDLIPLSTAAAAAVATAVFELDVRVTEGDPETRRCKSPGRFPFSLTRSDHLGSTSNMGLSNSHWAKLCSFGALVPVIFLPVSRLMTLTCSSPLSRFQSSIAGSTRGLRRLFESGSSTSGLVGRSGVIPC